MLDWCSFLLRQVPLAQSSARSCATRGGERALRRRATSGAAPPFLMTAGCSSGRTRTDAAATRRPRAGGSALLPFRIFSSSASSGFWDLCSLAPPSAASGCTRRRGVLAFDDAAIPRRGRSPSRSCSAGCWRRSTRSGLSLPVRWRRRRWRRRGRAQEYAGGGVRRCRRGTLACGDNPVGPLHLSTRAYSAIIGVVCGDVFCPDFLFRSSSRQHRRASPQRRSAVTPFFAAGFRFSTRICLRSCR